MSHFLLLCNLVQQIYVVVLGFPFINKRGKPRVDIFNTSLSSQNSCLMLNEQSKHVLKRLENVTPSRVFFFVKFCIGMFSFFKFARLLRLAEKKTRVTI